MTEKDYITIIEALNQMIRETGQGQGAIDAYVAQCEKLDQAYEELEQLRNQNRELRGRIRDLEDAR